jgi:hypothetical protein
MIITSLTASNRIFVFAPANTIADSTTVMFALQGGEHLAVLSSRFHITWATNAGSRLGMGNDPRYNKSRCFDPFPFPELADSQKTDLRALGEELDGHRKRQQKAHPKLTLTQMYNVLEKLRAGESIEGIWLNKPTPYVELGGLETLQALYLNLDLKESRIATSPGNFSRHWKTLKQLHKSFTEEQWQKLDRDIPADILVWRVRLQTLYYRFPYDQDALCHDLPLRRNWRRHPHDRQCTDLYCRTRRAHHRHDWRHLRLQSRVD